MITASARPTWEQQVIVDACLAGANLVIEADAGTGKTSTLRMAAAAMTGRTGLYLAYNRATAQSARSSFPAGVQCVTAHSLAYQAGGHTYAHRLQGPASRMPAWAIANVLGIGGPLPLGDQFLITTGHLARITMSTIERFCYSKDVSISGNHVPPVNGVDPASYAELTWHIVPLAERAWRDIQRPGGQLPFRHDHYLKMWQVTDPGIAADFIMFDEAQDANPVTAAIVQNQRDTQLIAVGDSCQAIYGWRGAIDALATWPADQRFQLSRSFRFGPAVATEANKWLETLGAQLRLSGTPQITSTVGAVADPHAILCRTNAEAFLQARTAVDAGRRAALAGGGREIGMLAQAALELQATGHTSNPELAAFRTWRAVQNYVRTDAAGADLAASVRLIDSHGPAEVIRTIGQLSSETRADVVVSTAHRAKGLEWGSVLVAPDFREPRRKAGQETPAAIPRSDAMLAYVAVTRARHELDRTGLAWIDNYAGVPPAASGGARRRKGSTMTITTPATREAPPPEGQPRDLGPYQGGRAQAESGSRIIQNDYNNRVAVSFNSDSQLPEEHPRFRQFANAWHPVERYGLGDDPGAAAIRYQVLAHATYALAEIACQDPAEATALERLADHCGKHAARLRATSEDQFLRSAMAAPYEGGRAQATGGSRLVERDYRIWDASAAAAQAATHTMLWRYAARLQEG
ncbi:MAG TPA: UvrD-helicase domain-containing protein [Streptosporangiaceae bacterium]|nr:UvrD-helicase domain-containing protein [Streptosporangiaceae bacterium]